MTATVAKAASAESAKPKAKFVPITRKGAKAEIDRRKAPRDSAEHYEYGPRIYVQASGQTLATWASASAQTLREINQVRKAEFLASA